MDAELCTTGRTIIQHALGVLHAPQKRPFRNHYLGPAGGDIRTLLEAMADRGLMRRGRVQDDGMQVFHATDAGATAAGTHLPGE